MSNPFNKNPNPYDDHDLDNYQADEREYLQSQDDSAEDALEADSKPEIDDDDDYNETDPYYFQGEY